MRISITAHEYVDGGVGALRPCVDRDVALRKHGHARDPAARRGAVNVDLKKRRPRRRGSVAQRRLDYFDVVKIRCLPEIDDKMRSGEAQAISLDEVVVDGVAWPAMKNQEA